MMNFTTFPTFDLENNIPFTSNWDFPMMLMLSMKRSKSPRLASNSLQSRVKIGRGCFKSRQASTRKCSVTSTETSLISNLGDILFCVTFSNVRSFLYQGFLPNEEREAETESRVWKLPIVFLANELIREREWIRRNCNLISCIFFRKLLPPPIINDSRRTVSSSAKAAARAASSDNKHSVWK